ncbi:hypothetical protein QBC38DRAFT_481593 [Podospora fimiseda]|uniref:C2H2-type domain-containing protein n=1 Tax=Podospora fimiseda TaxID=252190 RepID=A0AAN7GSM1_9PEZI|nr:hypothetical protein QBC38DRAFT_481593 [Podospora fimiseda]
MKKTSFCALCGKCFASSRAYKTHRRMSPNHNTVLCKCGSLFDTIEARDEHLERSPRHNKFPCECDVLFSSAEVRDQHLRESPIHNTDACECGARFDTPYARMQHLCASPKHGKAKDQHPFHSSTKSLASAAGPLTHPKVEIYTGEIPGFTTLLKLEINS